MIPEVKELKVGTKIKTRKGCGCGYDEFETELTYEVVEINEEKGKIKIREVSRIDTISNGDNVNIERVAMGSPVWCKMDFDSYGYCYIRNNSRGIRIILRIAA